MFYVIWTARLAVFTYLAAVALFLLRKPRLTTQIIWTAGFALFCLHVLAAFHFVHHWSHAAARQHTAEQTMEIIGWEWGGGIWFNYLFLVLWGVDVVLGWVRAEFCKGRMDRLTNLSRGIHLYLAFIVFNATAIFGPRWWKPVMAVVLLLLIGLACRVRRVTDLAHDKNS